MVKSHYFPKQIEQDLINILQDRFKTRENPNPGNLNQLLITAGKYEFFTKPFAIITTFMQEFLMLNYISGMGSLFKNCINFIWPSLHCLPVTWQTCATNTKRTTYVQVFTSLLEILMGLRFVSGSSVCPSEKLRIIFNSTSGFSRRPIAHINFVGFYY